MTVDLEAIARRSGCEISSLKLALPLVEQGYSPPFLARYRRDELGGISEPALWLLQRQVRAEKSLAARRQELTQLWERTRLADPSLKRAIHDAKSKVAMNRVGRRLKNEPIDPNAAIPPALWVASRILNPQPNDPVELAELAAVVDQAAHVDEIASSLDAVLAKRLNDHPQVLAAAIRWLNANASIKFLEVSDPNVDSSGPAETVAEPSHDATQSDRPQTEPGENWPSPEQLGAETPVQDSAVAQAASIEPTVIEAVIVEPAVAESVSEQLLTAELGAADTPAAELTSVETCIEINSPDDPLESQTMMVVGAFDPSTPEVAAAESVELGVGPAAETLSPAPAGGKGKSGKGKQAKQLAPKVVKKTKVLKKLSPRQRRRRWLIGILQPLVGKQIPIRKLSPFQTIVLSRALRGHLVRCQFVYDANQLISQLQKAAANLNSAMAKTLEKTIADHEAAIREATEASWWDELQEGATADLVDLTSRHLDAQLHRGPLEAKTILAIDAVGPRTSPVAIVSADGNVLHTEDIASQLENELRSAAVTRLGELIHRYGVDLIVVSNGPARRASLVILGELIAQSPEGSIRWTLAERSGADAYSGSEIADREMRTTPRRFRAATWLAFSMIKPAWALAKVNPTRLRLSSAQRELPEEALAPVLRDVMASAISRGGLDVNSAPLDALTQLPGITRGVAEAIDRQRRQSLFTSREQLLELEQWPDDVSCRQAIGFLRVFGGGEPLDATVIHPEDYSLARKLAKALTIELPASAPPGYEPPSFDEPAARESATSAAAVEAAFQPPSDTETNSPFAAELLDQATEPGNSTAGETPTDDASSPKAETLTAEVAAESTPTEATAEAPVAETPAADSPIAEATADAPAADGPSATSSARRPLPEPSAINKCIREWQVGSNRTHRIVHALCDPFGEESVANTSEPPVVMTRVPRPSQLKSGDPVIGVVASVAPFGAFVEISPESTGLVRVSRLAEEFVEEIHDYIQVGDVISAWVTEVDSKRKLQLSALSPQREESLRHAREEQRDRRFQRGGPPRRGGGGRAGGEGQQGAGQRGYQGSGQQGSGQQGSGQQGSGQRGDRGPEGAAGSREGVPQRTQSGQPIGGGVRTGGGDDRRGGHSDRGGRGGDRGQRGGDGRGRDSRPRREEPVSYTARVPKNQPPAPPISDAMAEGKEPLRSFGDLLQFFKKDTPQPPSKKESSASNKPRPAAAEETPMAAEGMTPSDAPEGTVQPVAATASQPAESVASKPVAREPGDAADASSESGEA